MFSNQIINSDVFLDMNMSAQALYFHLNMNADDDGFVSPRKIMRMLWSPDDDIKLLVMKWFVLPFADWIIVITHRKINNNQIKLDRYTPTLYKEHLKTMTQKEKVYSLELVGIQDGDISEPKSRVEKSRIEKKRVINTSKINLEEFERFWKLFPHTRKWKKAEAKKYFIKLKIKDVLEEVKLLTRKIKIGLQDASFVPACDRWIRDFTETGEVVKESIFREMIIYLKSFEWEKRGEISQKMKHDFWEEFIKWLWKMYWQSKKIQMRFTDDNGRVTKF